MGETRSAQVWLNEEWIEIKFRDIREGNRLKLFEPDGNPVTNFDEKEVEFIAASDAYWDSENMTWAIEVTV